MLDQEKDITTGTTPLQVRGRFWQDTRSGPRGHQLMTKEFADTIPAIGTNESVKNFDDILAPAKLFSPYNGWRWASSRGSRRKRVTSTWPSWQK